MAELLGVELARPGTWDLAVGGKTPFTAQMLRDAADFYTATGAQPIPVGLGHTDDRFDGDPAFGLVSNVRYVENEPGYDPGPVLLGDVTDVPDWLHAAAPTRWPNRSIEGLAEVEYEGRTYGLALTRLAFLGSTPPAMRNLRSLRHVQEALAAAQRIAASSPIAPTQTPAPAAEDAPPDEKGAGMNLAKYREALAGLPDDASEEDVTKALAAVGLSAPEPAPPADPPQPTPVNPPQPVGDPQPEPTSEPGSQELDQKIAAAAANQGVITLDATQAAHFQETKRRFAALEAKLDERDRDETITDAIKAGKFPPSRREHYKQYWAADREGAKTLIASLTPNFVPVSESGYAGDGSEDALWRSEFGSLFPPEITANGRGR